MRSADQEYGALFMHPHSISFIELGDQRSLMHDPCSFAAWALLFHGEVPVPLFHFSIWSLASGHLLQSVNISLTATSRWQVNMTGCGHVRHTPGKPLCISFHSLVGYVHSIPGAGLTDVTGEC
ncbi:hypothetical protein VDGL01_05433 [Verticillium dahliae]